MTTTKHLITGREAAALLGRAGVPRESARRVLTAGLAGRGVPVGRSVAYDMSAVQALVRMPLDEPDLPPELRRGCFVARVNGAPTQGVSHHDRASGSRRVSLHDDGDQRRAAVSDGWHMSPFTRIIFVLRAQRGVPMPFLATISGFVVVGGHITAATVTREHGAKETVRFTLEEPGLWYEQVHGRQLCIPPGGPWTLIPTDAGTRPWYGPR